MTHILVFLKRSNIKKILIYPERRKYLEAHFEYLIRYLGGEYFIEQAVTTHVGWGEDGHHPLMRFHDDYDLLIPHFTTHTFLPKSYQPKIAAILWDTGQFGWENTAAVGATSPIIERLLDEAGKVKYHSLRMGVDTNMFAPYPLVRDDDLFRIGYLGEFSNPRRNTREVFDALKDIEGTRFMTFPQNDLPMSERLSKVFGGDEFKRTFVAGAKFWPGIANCYNQFDVLVRADTNQEYGFTVLEAAACGVPSICTNKGNAESIINAGGAIEVKGTLDEVLKQTVEAVKMLRDNPEKGKDMGIKGREEVVNNWQWEKFLPNWRAFLDEGLANAEKNYVKN